MLKRKEFSKSERVSYGVTLLDSIATFGGCSKQSRITVGCSDGCPPARIPPPRSRETPPCHIPALPNSAATARSAFFEKRGLAEAGAQDQLDHDAPDSRKRSRRARTTRSFCRKMFSVTPTSLSASPAGAIPAFPSARST